MSSNLQPEQLLESLEKWTQVEHEEKGFNLTDEQLHWEIYDLLGGEALTPEVVEALMSLLDASDEFRPVQLFQRLEDFYLRWCDGEFIDAPAENFPQKKMRLLKEQLPTQKIGQRQVDIYAGLSVMILLLELHRYALSKDYLKDEIAFYPCGKKDTEGFDENRLLHIISYSNCFGEVISNFNTIVGKFFRGANLIHASLGGADFRGADLIDANFGGAYLSDANFSGANLSHANLSGADLIRANLKGANLIGADLISADLIRANLKGADMSRTNLKNADLSRADLSGAQLSSANLDFADLSRANLSEANLSCANLIHANLSGANLSGANLRAKLYYNANLSGANLRSADLRSTDLRTANLRSANLENITWNEGTKWDDVQGLQSAKNTPAALKQQLGLE
ncbi:pentapeptide repeat-containing protein [Microcoleus sp. FACHB-672]|uniref:pentapeptide repeat-containing protein n=1 Tax=Microcoleus sp. FACHB-672 TaxID=2692825 RepID=UPI001682DEC1|nr:pentapeptide repeat-containing protein [Microcoleus sp. FACHB-672]MBD2042114.1 pentapeptide repeat-containing protein [Microcoleus sp. FACHB-672]